MWDPDWRYDPNDPQGYYVAGDAEEGEADAALPVNPVEVARLPKRRSARAAVGAGAMGAMNKALEVKELAMAKIGGIVHFKGFAGNIDFKSENTLAGVCAVVRELNRYEVVVFDGDKFKPGSFTWVLTNDLYKRRDEHGYRIPELTVKKFVAFSDDPETHARACIETARAVGIKVNPEVQTAAFSARKVKAGLTVFAIDRETSDGVVPWVMLGVNALKATGAKNVVTLGGGDTVMQEIKAGKEIDAKYTIVPIDRVAGGKLERTPLCSMPADLLAKGKVSFVLLGGGSRVSGGVAKSCKDFYKEEEKAKAASK